MSCSASGMVLTDSPLDLARRLNSCDILTKQIMETSAIIAGHTFNPL